MCVVSMITDYYGKRPDTPWTPESWDKLLDVVKRLEELDVLTGQPHCEDPAKAKWMKDVEDRLKVLEGK